MLALLLTCCVAVTPSPDVFFISVDTLRADYLGCYGHAAETSPHLNAFAGDALVFEDCVCEVPLTSPSFGSMLTSRYPRTTGTTRNGLPMPLSVPRVPELFKAKGYQTFCVQSNWTLKAKLSALDRGFDTYEDDFHKKRWGLLKAERYADEVTDIALDLLGRRKADQPLFCWIHYSDPHAPYKYHRRFDPNEEPLRKQDKVGRVRSKYDTEVAFLDHHLNRLMEAIPKENSVVLFVADHGESLYEHDYLGHGRRIYQPGLHIPFILRGPGVSPGRSSAPIRGVDVAPTLLGFAGITPPEGMEGLDVRKASIPAARVRVVETYGGAVPKLPGARAMMAGRPPMRQGVLHEGWKLILRGKGPELFDVSTDPMELKNLAKEEPARVEKLRAFIETWDDATLRGKTVDAELSEDDLEALKSLGYLE